MALLSRSSSQPKETGRQLFRAVSRRLSMRHFHTATSLFSFFQKSSTQSSRDVTQMSPSEESIFEYQAQRWLWNEQDQLQRRYLRFDVKALIAAAEKAVGPQAGCEELIKLAEGNFNKAMLIKMRSKQQVIARLPNPNAGRPHFNTASEVATMDYVRNRLQIPVPKVLAYSTRADNNPVGAEYIIMEKCPGIELRRMWKQMSGKEKAKIVGQVAEFSAKLSKARFPYYGSLYYSKDIPGIKGTEIDDTFSVGPITARSWFDDGKGQLDIFRGPWNSVAEILEAVVDRETACLETFPDFPRDRQQGIFNGPGGYQPSKPFKTAVIRDVSRVLHAIIPSDEAYTAAVLWHNDLHLENLFVNENCPTEITGIIDWQGVHISPAFMHVGYPTFVNHEGPQLEGFTKPELPSNFAELDPVSKERARNLHTAQSLLLLYRIGVQQETPDVMRVLHYQKTLPCEIMVLIGAIYGDGEPYLQSLLAQLSDPNTWRDVVSAAGRDADDLPCPLTYTGEEISQQKKEMNKWAEAIEKKARVIEELGAYTGWDGAVMPVQFSEMKKALQNAKTRFLDAESNTPEERAQWERAWPFQDSRT